MRSLTAAQKRVSVSDPTILLQMSDEDVAGFRPLSGVVKWNVSVHILQEHVDSSLQKRCDGEGGRGDNSQIKQNKT